MSENNEKKQKDSNSTLIAAGVAFTVMFIILGFLVATKDKRASNQDLIEETQLANVVDTVENGELESDEAPENEVEITVNEDEAETELETEETFFPDIIITDYYFSEEDIMQNEEITVTIEIRNDGEEDAGEFNWEWWSDEDTVSCDGDIEFLDVDEEETIDCKFTYEDFGSFKTKIVLDSNDDIDESNENNNSESLQIEVSEEEYVDLTINEYSFDPVPEKGVPFTVRIGIRNEGNIASGSFHWEWWGTAYNYACRDDVSTIAPNSEKVVTCDYTYGGWSTYATKAVVDSDNEIEESNEDNNEYEEEVVPIH